MGRGRAKAKQTKVARALKYQALDTNFDALQRELGHEEPNGASSEPVDDLDEDDDDPYAAYADDADDDALDSTVEDADQAVRRR